MLHFISKKNYHTGGTDGADGCPAVRALHASMIIRRDGATSLPHAGATGRAGEFTNSPAVWPYHPAKLRKRQATITGDRLINGRLTKLATMDITSTAERWPQHCRMRPGGINVKGGGRHRNTRAQFVIRS